MGVMNGQPAERTPEARVLVVDDEPMIVELLTVSLRYQGFEVAAAANGAEGWIGPGCSGRTL